MVYSEGVLSQDSLCRRQRSHQNFCCSTHCMKDSPSSLWFSTDCVKKMLFFFGLKLRRKKNRKTEVSEDTEVAPAPASPSKASLSQSIETYTTGSISKGFPWKTASASSSTISSDNTIKPPTTEASLSLHRPKMISISGLWLL